MTFPDDQPSTSTTFGSFDKKFENNVIYGDRTEILFDKSTFGLVDRNILTVKPSDSYKEVEIKEGKIKLYATLTTKHGNYKVTVINTDFNFTVGNQTKTVNFKDGYAEIDYDAPVGSNYVYVLPADPNYYRYYRLYYYNVDNELVYTDKSLSYMDDYTWAVNLIVTPIEYTIDVNDTEARMKDGMVPIPIVVKDNDGNPATGNVKVTYPGNERNIRLNNDGAATVYVYYPTTEETTFQLTVEYHHAAKTITVNVVDPSAYVPDEVVFTFPNNITGHINSGIDIRVEVKDQNGKPLDGLVEVMLNGRVLESVEAEKGIAIIPLILPDKVGPHYLELTMHGMSDSTIINAYDNGVVIEDPEVVIIEAPYKMVGHIGKTIEIPINVINVINGNRVPLNGTVRVMGYTNDITLNLVSGKANAVLNLPSRSMEFNVNIKYGNVSVITKIRVIDPSSIEPTNDTQIIIHLDDIVGFKGNNIPVPILIHDSNGNNLNGQITYSYLNVNGQADLENGTSIIHIGLPTNPTTFVLTVNYQGVVKQAFVNVVDAKNPLGNISKLNQLKIIKYVLFYLIMLKEL